MRRPCRSEEAAPARQYLLDRNFDPQAAAHFGCGFAPSGWDSLTKHLLRKGFEFKELEAAGLSREGRRGPMDRFHRRLLWPIRASGSEVIGFGARRIFDDDSMEAKYINTPETVLYKKSSVLFGLDLAKRDIAKGHQAVVVEGYTDVMAMHLAGVTTAVASCGTAFGDEHLYELGKPRYEPHECRQLRLTYGRPFRVWLRLTKEEPIEEEVYLGDIPIMLGGGEFIINGAERVVVSQLHRSPGVDFVTDTDTAERKMFSARIIPERGSWIELNASKKDTLQVRIDQSGKFSAMMLLRAMDSKYGQDAELLRTFYDTTVEKVVDGRSVGKIEGKIAVTDIVYPPASEKAGEVIVESGHKITKNLAEVICTSGLSSVEVMPEAKVPLILNSLEEDATGSHEEARCASINACARQSAAVGKGQSAVPREVLRHQPLSARPRRPVPH